MGSRVAIAAVAIASGCGRLAFDPTSDAATADSALDAATPLCGDGLPTLCTGAEVFCDGFESSSGSMFPAWSGVFRQNWTGGALSPQTSVATASPPTCRGSMAIVGTGVGAGQLAFLRKVLSARSSVMHARMMFYIPTTTSTRRFDLFGWDQSLGGTFLLLSYDPGGRFFELNPNFTGPPGTGPYDMPRDQWVCLEIEVHFATTTAGRVLVRVDDQLVLDTIGVTEPAGVILDQFEVGISTANNETTTLQLFFDEVAVSTQRLGCS